VPLASHIVAVSPRNATYLGTLGAARYAAGDWKGAVAALEQAIRLRGPDDPGNAASAFFLARARWQQGVAALAREWFNKAVRWMKESGEDAELRRFRAETAKLLGLK